jgi:peptidase E
LGPQRLKPTLIEAIEEEGLTGRIATVTAGWQEREPEDYELHTHLGRRSVNLHLYERAEHLFQRDPVLSERVHARQVRLRELQSYYDLRLRHMMEACKALDQRSENGATLESERAAAMDVVRRLDWEHLDRIRETHQETDAQIVLSNHPELQRHRDEVAKTIAQCDGVAIAGGHVAVLLNRLRLFDLENAIGRKPVFAWSAGAMAIAERIVLYHDSPPQGPGNAEVLEHGLGLVGGVVALPHAYRRMLLDDTARVSRFARRFEPAWCIAMEDGATLRIKGETWQASEGNQRLLPTGSLEDLKRG